MGLNVFCHVLQDSRKKLIDPFSFFLSSCYFHTVAAFASNFGWLTSFRIQPQLSNSLDNYIMSFITN